MNKAREMNFCECYCCLEANFKIESHCKILSLKEGIMWLNGDLHNLHTKF